MADKRTFEFIKYTFVKDEIRELGESLARASQVVIDLNAQKKRAVAALQASLADATKQVGDLTIKINNGYELREVECMAMMETPRPGLKRIIRIDTNETVREEPMTMQEMQTGFGFADPEK